MKVWKQWAAHPNRFWALLTLLCGVVVAVCILLPWDALPSYQGYNTASLHYLPAKVLSVDRETIEKDELDSARYLGGQTLTVRLLAGQNKGSEITLENYLTRTQCILAKTGDTLIICADLPDSAAPYYTVYSYSRAPALALVLALFALAVVAVGGAKGVRTLLGLGFTGALVGFLLLPALYHGLPSLPITILTLGLATLASLLLLNPPGAKTLAAVLSTLGGVGVAGALFLLFCGWLHLSGMNDDNAAGLVLVAGQTGLELHWLLLIAVLISSLGAVMDVCLSLASALDELRQADSTLSARGLFGAGIRIGRDMIGTMSNTLILAFAGEAVTTLLLLLAYGWQPQQLLGSDYIAIQVAQGAASTMGVVLSVPLTAGVAAYLYRPGRVGHTDHTGKTGDAGTKTMPAGRAFE
ncbi:MAG: YibE/F family protein [Gemmiger sp.]|nr:YibE/F family protein [Gemmiger sp.]